MVHIVAPFASLKKQAETLFWLICCKRKTMSQLKNKLKKLDYKINKHDLRAKFTPLGCSVLSMVQCESEYAYVCV